MCTIAVCATGLSRMGYKCEGDTVQKSRSPEEPRLKCGVVRWYDVAVSSALFYPMPEGGWGSGGDMTAVLYWVGATMMLAPILTPSLIIGWGGTNWSWLVERNLLSVREREKWGCRGHKPSLGSSLALAPLHVHGHSRTRSTKNAL